jgi:hypothetical protein
VYSSKQENLDEMDKFLNAYNQPKLNQEDINHLNNLITYNEIKAVIKILPTKKSPVHEDSWSNFTKLLKKNTNTL